VCLHRIYARKGRHRITVYYSIRMIFTVPVRANRKSTSGCSGGGGFARLCGSSRRPPAIQPSACTTIIIIRERHKLTTSIRHRNFNPFAERSAARAFEIGSFVWPPPVGRERCGGVVVILHFGCTMYYMLYKMSVARVCLRQ